MCMVRQAVTVNKNFIINDSFFCIISTSRDPDYMKFIRYNLKNFCCCHVYNC